MKWTPDTHPISFEIENGVAVSFTTDVDEWKGLSPQDLHSSIKQEHSKVNTLAGKTDEEISEIKDLIMSGGANLKDYGI